MQRGGAAREFLSLLLGGLGSWVSRGRRRAVLFRGFGIGISEPVWLWEMVMWVASGENMMRLVAPHVRRRKGEAVL